MYTHIYPIHVHININLGTLYTIRIVYEKPEITLPIYIKRLQVKYTT